MSPAGLCPLLMAVLLRLLVPSDSFGNGQVSDSCSSLVPGHRGSGQTSPSPYKLTVNATAYGPGDQILVSLTGSSPFMGFLLQARDSAGQDGAVVGRFSLTDPTRTQLLTCDQTQDSAVSHSSDDQKEEVSVIWTAPLESVDQVQFFVTVVRSFSEFWVKVPGPVVHDINFTQNATLPSVTTPPLPTTTPSILPGPFTSEGCGQSKSCLLDPPGCDPGKDPWCFFLSMSEDSPTQSVMFELSGPSDGYVSFALSLDSWMGNDDVYLCVREGERVFVSAAVTRGRTVPEGETQAGLSLVSWRLADGVIQCSFSRPVVLDDQEARFDLDRPYFLFLASGLTESGRLLKHWQQPLISRGSKLVTGAPEVLRGTRSPTIMKMHGALMMVAWILTGSVGTFIASFYKTNWQNKTLLGQKIWFQLHRGLMLLTVTLTVTAYCLPFIYRGGWSKNAGSHPPLGQTVLVLALIQPIVAAFRPEPQAPRRKIFNIFHIFLGASTEILAGVSIFQGMIQPALFLPQPTATYVYIGYTLWVGVFRTALQIHRFCCLSRSQRESGEPEMKDSVKTMLLAGLALGNIAFLSVLLNYIANV